MQLVFKIANLCGPDPPTLQTDRQTDGRTTCDRNTALCTIVHRAVKSLYATRNELITQSIKSCYLRLCWFQATLTARTIRSLLIILTSNSEMFHLKYSNVKSHTYKHTNCTRKYRPTNSTVSLLLSVSVQCHLRAINTLLKFNFSIFVIQYKTILVRHGSITFISITIKLQLLRILLIAITITITKLSITITITITC